jgi:hypothetical protein
VLFACVAALLSLALVLAAVEAFLRLADPIGLNYDREVATWRAKSLRFAWDGVPKERYGEIDLDGTLFRMKPSLDLDLGSFRLRTNALGFRGPEISRDKPEGTFRIVVLGDSVAFGYGVDDEVTFLRRWEKELNAKGPGRFEVVNTGHLVYDTMQEYALLRDDGMRLQPDLVLLVFVANDIEPTRDVVEQLLLHRPPDPAEALRDPGDLWTTLADWCRPLLPATAKLLELRSDPAVRILSALPPGTEFVPEKLGKGPRGWLRSQQALLGIAELCSKANVPFAVLDHARPELRALPEFCRAHGIRYFPFLLTPEQLKLPVSNSMLDPHHNALGHELVLERLRAIAAELPLPR